MTIDLVLYGGPGLGSVPYPGESGKAHCHRGSRTAGVFSGNSEKQKIGAFKAVESKRKKKYNINAKKNSGNTVEIQLNRGISAMGDNQTMETIRMPENVKHILSVLHAAGFEASCVGGCVRDSLLGRTPGDWDITTSALPQQVKKLFRHTIDTGIEHGTVTVLLYPDEVPRAESQGNTGNTGSSPDAAFADRTGEGGKAENGKAEYRTTENGETDNRTAEDGKTGNGSPENKAKIFETEAAGMRKESVREKKHPSSYEVTTYRIDGAYQDGRHPEQVTFTPLLAEDLRRRDFTINAMAYNETEGLTDLFGGREDLKNRVIRCVGCPDERFDEDALRILRAVRFAAQLDFAIEPETAEAVTRHAARLGAVSRERIYVELNKLLCSAHPERLQVLFRLGLGTHIVPGFEAARPIGPGTACPLEPEGEKSAEINGENIGEKIGEEGFRFTEIPQEKRYLRYALIFRGMEGKTAKQLLTGLKADAETAVRTAYACERLLEPLPSDRYEFKKKIAETDPEHFRELLELKKLISHTTEYKAACGKENIRGLLFLFDRIMEKEEPIYMKDLVVTGRTLMEAGVPEGPQVGKILAAMLDDVRREPVHNSILYLFSKHLV